MLLEESFANKWGAPPVPLEHDNLALVASVQFVVIAVMLALVRPGFVTVQRDALSVPQLALLRIVALASVVVAATYLYPLWKDLL